MSSLGDNASAMAIRVVKPGSGSAVQVSPGATLPPTDTDGDGIHDDVNGNGRGDFADVVLYFDQRTWTAGNEPLEGFDCNDDGRIDFADLNRLFNHP